MVKINPAMVLATLSPLIVMSAPTSVTKQHLMPNDSWNSLAILRRFRSIHMSRDRSICVIGSLSLQHPLRTFHGIFGL